MGSARSRGRKRHPKPRRHLPPPDADLSEPLGGGDWSPLTPMGMVEGYGRIARGLKRSIRDGQFGGRRAIPLLVLVALPFALIAVAALAIAIIG